MTQLRQRKPTHQLHISIPRRRGKSVFPHIRPIHAKHFPRVLLPSTDWKILTLALLIEAKNGGSGGVERLM